MQGAIAETRVEENRQRVLDVAQELVDRFISSEMVDTMPTPIRLAFIIISSFLNITYSLFSS